MIKSTVQKPSEELKKDWLAPPFLVTGRRAITYTKSDDYIYLINKEHRMILIKGLGIESDNIGVDCGLFEGARRDNFILLAHPVTLQNKF